MNDEEFKEFLTLMMCCDPWPVEDDGTNQHAMTDVADQQSENRGFESWIVAYHEFEVKV